MLNAQGAFSAEGSDVAFQHICEVCGLTVLLTGDIAYELGWDYPPKMGEWGIVSPRTCGNCAMTDTVWWAITQGARTKDLSDHQLEVVRRILVDEQRALRRARKRETDARNG